MDTSTLLTRLTNYVGIDVSKSWLDCYLRPQGAYLQVENTTEGFNRIRDWLIEQGCTPTDTVLCLENTGVYDDRLLEHMNEAGWLLAVEHTRVLSKITPQHHRKEDAFDAACLAEYADRFADELHLFRPSAQVIKRLRGLFSERRRLVVQRASVKTKQTQSRQLTLLSPLIEQSWHAQLRCYNQQIHAIERRIRRLIKEHSELHTYNKLLQSIPGVGPITAWLWLILFYGDTQLNAKRIASRFGFAPHSYRSGSSVRGQTRSSGHGASQMRQYMNLAARSASTHCPTFRAYKQRKKQDGKPWPIICNNVINKLIKIMCAIWNTNTPYRDNHTSRFERQKKVA